MPERLLSVISGILAGGIPGFRIELCCCYHPLAWPLCVVLCFLGFASFSVAILIMTHDVIVHVTLIAGSDPTSLCFVLFGLVWFGCGCGCFVCLVVFVFGLCFLFS